jgi:hypothetical protein
MISDPKDRKLKIKKKPYYLALVEQPKSISEILKDAEKLKDIPISELKPIIINEIIPKEQQDYEEFFNNSIKINNPVFLENKTTLKIPTNKNFNNKDELEYNPYFENMPEIKLKKQEQQPQILERLLETKTDFLVEQYPYEQKIKIEIKKIQEIEPMAYEIELNQKEYILPTLENIQKIQIKYLDAFPIEQEIELNEKLYQKKFYYFPWMDKTLNIELSKYVYLPQSDKINLEEKIYSQINKFKEIEYIKHTQINRNLNQENIKNKLKELYLQKDIVNQIDPKSFEFYYENLPNQAKLYLNIIKYEEQYWELTKNKDKENYQELKENFVKSLEKLEEKERKTIEEIINISKALALLKIISEEQKNHAMELLIKEYNRSISKLSANDIDIIKYEFSKYIFIKNFNEAIDKKLDQRILQNLDVIDKEFSNWIYAHLAVLYDNIVNDQNVLEELKIFASEKYADLLMNSSLKISEKISIIKQLHSCLEDYFAKAHCSKIANRLKEGKIEKLFSYELAYSLYKIKNIGRG